MTEKHPLIYNEFDIEAARKAGHEDERNRILALLPSFFDTYYKAESHVKQLTKYILQTAGIKAKR